MGLAMGVSPGKGLERVSLSFSKPWGPQDSGEQSSKEK